MIEHQPALPPGSVVVVPGCVHVVRAWAPDLLHDLMVELGPLLEVHRGFRGMPDPGRRTARLGDRGVSYVYNGKAKPMRAFTPVAAMLRDKVAGALGVPFNCAYVNLYESGAAGLPRHRDTALLPQLGPRPVIAALSFGAARPLQFWRADAPRDKAAMLQAVLSTGDLCVMHGDSQASWLHGVPKDASVTLPRLSLTFRHHSA